MRNPRIAVWLALVVTLSVGCEDYFTNAGPAGADGSADGEADAGASSVLFNGEGVGAKCTDDDVCRSGLACTSGACAPSGKKAANDACLLSAECEGELQCGFFGFCVVSGGRKVNETCTSVSDCEKGLFCNLQGVTGFCTAPAKVPKDLYASCKETKECWPGLHCNASGQCMPGSVTLSPDLFPGSTCPVREEAELPFQARNHIPRGDEATQGFYATPFPSDLRIKKGKVDLSAHPRPGTGLIGLDLIGNVIDGLSAEMDGFSIAPTIYFRWTRPLDPKSLVTSGPQRNVFFFNAKTGEQVEFTQSFKPARNKYICANWLAIHPTWKNALDAKTTYVVYITDSVRADLGEGADPKELVPAQSADLKTLLSNVAPKDATEKAAWDAYKTLRKVIADKKQPVAKIVAATQFTTQDPTRFMRQFNEIALKAKAPKLMAKAFQCGVDKGTSPCATPGIKAGTTDPRGCPANAASNPWREYHLQLEMPTYQDGARPYLDGGGQLKVQSGKPQITGYETVCMTLTVPKSAKPAAGWPLVLYAHGTGGSHRSGAAQMGKQLSTLKDGPTSVAMATLGIDGSMHGNRRGVAAHAANIDPGPLFYNFANPPAAKGNFYQGAADNFTLIRYVRAAKLDLVGAGKVNFNPKKLYYMGHSQGGTTGPLFAPYAHDLSGNSYLHAYVFSGAGAGLVFSLLNKKSPEDATIGIKLALQEVDLDEYHPALALFQYYYDEVDPLVYGPLYYTKPDSQPVHVLHTFGQGDTYTPPETSRIYAASTGGKLLKPTDAGDWFDPIDDLGVIPADHKATVSGNISAKFNGKTYKVTGVTVQHLNDTKQSTNGKAYDGHFIAFKDKLCNKQVGTFFATAVAKGTPAVPHK